MEGPCYPDDQTQGMIPRALQQVFAAARDLSDKGWTVRRLQTHVHVVVCTGVYTYVHCICTCTWLIDIIMQVSYIHVHVHVYAYRYMIIAGSIAFCQHSHINIIYSTKPIAGGGIMLSS